MNKNMYDSAAMLRIRGGVSAVGYNIENELFELIMSKVKDYFGYKVKLDYTKSHQKLIIEYDDKEGLENLLNKFNIDL